MRDGWRTATLNDIAEVVVGGTPSTKEPAYWGGEVVWATPTDITSLEGPVLTSSERRITETGLQKSSARLVPRGSVLVTTRATIGPAAVAGTELATNQGVTALVPRGNIDPRWLYYWVLANRSAFVGRGAGNTFPEVSRSKTRAIPLDIPPLPEQRRIAELAKAIDFAVTQASRAARHAASSEQALRNHLIDSISTRTPAGEFLLGIDAGKSPQAEDRIPEASSWGVLKVTAVRTNEYHPLELKRLPDDYVVDERHVVQKGDVLVTRAGGNMKYVGVVCEVDQDPGKAMLCDKTLRLRLDRQKVDQRYVVQAFASRQARKQIEIFASGGAGQLNVSQAQIKKVELPLPKSREEQQAFASTIDAASEVVRAHERAIKSLRRCRDAVLVALVSGKHEMPESYDRFLEEAATQDVDKGLAVAAA